MCWLCSLLYPGMQQVIKYHVYGIGAILIITADFLYHAAGADFIPQFSVQLQFGPLESEFCVNVSIIDDSILESDEQFEVLMETSEAVVTLNPSTAAVSIIDNDSK